VRTIDLKLETIGVEPPIGNSPQALVTMFGCLDGSIFAFGSLDLDLLLNAFEVVAIGADKIFEEFYNVPFHCTAPSKQE
jgi:hypothetical protein